MTFNPTSYELVNFKKIYSIANEYLAIAPSITGFPFSVKVFLHEQTDIALCSYSKATLKFGIDVAVFESKSATLQEFSGAYIIFYNDKEAPPRVRFSIIHEFAHYVLHHKPDLSPDDPRYKTQELEANCFAAQLLMPEQLLRECASRHVQISVSFIKEMFGVSEAAAYKRQHTLAVTNAEWRTRAEKRYDDIILSRYSGTIRPFILRYRKYNPWNYDDDYERQVERDSWLDTRTRWDR
ncbi:MAG: ImmA/IrrE family metallo-endopeptidase [Lachnospiraceae bacterium]|nr:ImmA/IrrE family metallo-endopeptidase [Lachnospiraceae bacterium]